jgi:hypothetical protein
VAIIPDEKFTITEKISEMTKPITIIRRVASLLNPITCSLCAM